MPVARVYKIASPFNASELEDVDFEQTADVVYYAHENHAPLKLIRRGHTDWEYVDVAITPLIATPAGVAAVATNPNQDSANSGNSYFPQPASYVVTAYNEVTGQESRASSVVTVTNDLGLKRNYNSISWGGVTGATSYRVYKRENTQAFGYIGSTDQLSFRDDNIGADLSEGPPVGDNPFAASGDYPGCVTFHEQRAIWGRTRNRPNGVWWSRSADYENFDFRRPLREDDAGALGLVANKVNAVNQLVSTKQGLLALTSNNIFVITGSTTDYLTTVPPPRSVPEISRGAAKMQPITIDNVTFYKTAKGCFVHMLGFKFEIEGIQTDDVTLFSRHLFENFDIIQWTWAETPGSTIVGVRADGKIVCLTWDQPQEVWGWTVWETDGIFKSVTSIYEAGVDRIYCLVERVIDGVTRLYIERFANPVWVDAGQQYACFLDCAKSWFLETPQATFDRLEHLEGREVMALVDGSVVNNLTVTNGEVTLPNAGLIVHIGLPFTAEMQTLPLAMQTRSGWNIGKPQHVGDVIVKVVDTRGILVGSSEDQLYEPKLRDGELYGEPTDLVTGNLEMSTAGVSGDEVSVWIKSEEPVPMTIAGVLLDPQGAPS